MGQGARRRRQASCAGSAGGLAACHGRAGSAGRAPGPRRERAGTGEQHGRGARAGTRTRAASRAEFAATCAPGHRGRAEDTRRAGNAPGRARRGAREGEQGRAPRRGRHGRAGPDRGEAGRGARAALPREGATPGTRRGRATPGPPRPRPRWDAPGRGRAPAPGTRRAAPRPGSFTRTGELRAGRRWVLAGCSAAWGRKQGGERGRGAGERDRWGERRCRGRRCWRPGARAARVRVGAAGPPVGPLVGRIELGFCFFLFFLISKYLFK
jgi:hypothetical protein